MHRPDDELIAALAEGRLDPDEAASVEAAVRAHPDAVIELRAQRVALEALARLEPVTLEREEREALRRSVATAVGVDDTSGQSPSHRRRVKWPAVAAAAAALTGVLAAAPLVGMLSTGGDRAGFDRTAVQVTERLGDQSSVEEDGGPMLSSGSDDGAHDPEFAFGDSPPTPGTVVTETTAPPDDHDLTEDPPSPEHPWSAELQRVATSAFPDGWELGEAVLVETESACAVEGRQAASEAGADHQPGDPAVLVAPLVGPEGRRLLVFLAVGEDGELGPIAVIDPVDCSTVPTP